MATGRFISAKEAADAKLNSMSFGHIVGFLRLCVHADDWGRFYGAPEMWKSQLFPRQRFVSEQLVLAIQHDLAAAGMVGFYKTPLEEYALVFNFFEHQQLKATHLRKSPYPTPPQEMWAHFAHPRETGKSFDVPDMPYERYCAARDKYIADHGGELPAPNFPPTIPRPTKAVFMSDPYCPFGAIERPEAKAPAGQGQLLSAPKSEQEGKILALLHDTKKWQADHDVDLTFVRRLAADFPKADLLKAANEFHDYYMTGKLPAGAKMHQRFRRWVDNAVNGFEQGKTRPQTGAGKSFSGAAGKTNIRGAIDQGKKG